MKHRRKVIPVITIRAVYDGQTFKALPGEPLPKVKGEVPVKIEFPDQREEEPSKDLQNRRTEAARRLLEARRAMPPWNVNLKDLVEEGRE